MLLTSSWLERVEGGPEPGSVDHFVVVPRAAFAVRGGPGSGVSVGELEER